MWKPLSCVERRIHIGGGGGIAPRYQGTDALVDEGHAMDPGLVNFGVSANCRPATAHICQKLGGGPNGVYPCTWDSIASEEACKGRQRRLRNFPGGGGALMGHGGYPPPQPNR